MATLAGQKAEGDAAFREGRLEEAVACYTAALAEHGAHAPTLCNRSLAALKLGRAEDALRDAEEALALLAQQGAGAGQLAKAFHRKAEALLGLGCLLEGIQAYRQGLEACQGCEELHAALRLAAEALPVPWLAKYWAARVEAAQAPHPLSARDGRLLKRVPRGERLEPAALLAHLEAALYPLQDEARDMLCEAWATRRKPGRAEAAFFRAAAYLNAGAAAQALKDARFALVYGPQLEAQPGASCAAQAGCAAGSSGCTSLSTHVAPAPAAPPPAPLLPPSAWPAALALLSAAHEGLADNVPAALAMQRALELEPDSEDYSEALERLLRRIPEACAAALQAGGAAGLEAHLAAEREAGRPEYLRQRPKYYYYYQWMRKRIAAQYPALPEPVVDKLLGLEANELDLVLQYPAATRLTVERLLEVYHQQGPERLEGFAVPLLSWEDYQAIRQEGAGAAALPAGGGPAAEGRLLEGAQGGGAAGKAAQVQGAAAGAGVGAGAGSSGVRQAEVAPAGAAAAGGDDAASEAGSVDIDELCALE